MILDFLMYHSTVLSVSLSVCVCVCVKVIGLFDRGQAWEHGIPLCKELCTLYETEIQYNELAATLVSTTFLFPW